MRGTALQSTNGRLSEFAYQANDDDADRDQIMAQRVTLDAMIPREDFALEGKEFVLDLFERMPLSNLAKDSPILKLLRKPDFQRETNHWTPEQIHTFIASFLDNEIIPSLILWKSPEFIFVIDSGHRLSALRAWMEDDYGDRTISEEFFGKPSKEQKRIAEATRRKIEAKIGRYSALHALVGTKSGTDEQKRRANSLVTRTLQVQWIQGSASVAETSFFKINSQGTPLDDTEAMLIENRRKPIAINARAVLRAGAGHKYWSAFPEEKQGSIEKVAAEFYEVMFEPEVEEPLKTLELSLGGSVSPVDALALLVEFMTVAGTRQPPTARTATSAPKPMSIDEYDDDEDGTATILILKNTLEIVRRITGNGAASLGLHPAVYFYNEKGKYNRFLFLGMSQVITDAVRNNDKAWFKKFTDRRKEVERFLIENKTLIGILLQNMAKDARVPKMRDLIAYLVSSKKTVKPEEAIQHLGLHGRIYDVVASKTSATFSDETKTVIFVRSAISSAIECPICGGKLDPKKSVSYDHKTRVRDGGLGDPENGALVHPYCNTGIKN